MSQAAACEARGAVAAFDGMAASYDALFTESVIGRAQRGVVWAALERRFRAGDRVLELNCGTGEDAAFLKSRGVRVTACDASPAMIEVAERRRQRGSTSHLGGCIEFRVLRNEDLGQLASEGAFDGVLSNFSGLNCVQDLSGVAMNLGKLVKQGGPALFCMSTRVCLWELAWYGARGKFTKALRRVHGRTVARLDGVSIPVWYPTVRQLRRVFGTWFRLRSIRAVGLLVPPSYVESLARKHRRLLAACAGVDRVCAGWPGLRVVGDHVLLEFERTATAAAR